MINSEYKLGCRLIERVKYNINYDQCQIMNHTCANYMYDIIQQRSQYKLSYEDKQKIVTMIYNLLGHEIKIEDSNNDIQYKCYFGIAQSEDIIDEEKITSLGSFLSANKSFVGNVTTNYQIVIYAYPQEFGKLQSIKDQTGFELLNSFTESEMVIDGVNYFVYQLTDPSTVDNYKLIFS